MSFKKALNILLISILAITASAQKDKNSIEIRDRIWNKSGAEFKNTEIPEEWKNESAVILFQDYKYLFDRQGKGLTSEISYHSRVALQDKAAVKEYSEFSFSERFSGTSNYRYYRGKTYNGFKIIKADGTERIVDMDTAVPVESENSRNSVKKIAIPDLQEGDIIDYYYHAIEYTTAVSNYHTFSPVLTTLGTDYPVVYLRREFEVEKKFYINYRPVNGAPDIVTTDKEKTKVFTVESRKIDKIESADWMYPYRSLPTIKFQVMYAKTPILTSNLGGFAGVAGIVKSELDAMEVKDFGNIFVSKSTYVNMNDFKQYLFKNKISLSDLSDREKAIQVYYYLYHISIKEKLEKYFLGINNRDSPGLANYYFVQNMSAYFNALDLKGELLLTTDREYTSIEDALLKEEFGFVVRWLGGNEGDLYFGNVTLHPHINNIPTEFEGAEAYVFPFSGKIWQPKKETIPASHYKSNRSVVDSDYSFDEDMEKMNVHNNTKTFGHNRDWFQYRFLTMYDYLTEENEKMGISPIMESVKKRDRIELQETIAEYKKSADKARMSDLENLVAHELNTTDPEVSNFKILKNGRFDETAFEFEYDAKFDGLLQQAGPNYLFNVGLLIGQQKEIEEKNMRRDEDIYMPNARSYFNNINCTIPEGYSVEGLDKLTFNIKNETGGFISSASMEGNILKIKTEKWYANNYEKAENWPKMLEFLEAAYEFTGAKVLLKKQ